MSASRRPHSAHPQHINSQTDSQTDHTRPSTSKFNVTLAELRRELHLLGYENVPDSVIEKFSERLMRSAQHDGRYNHSTDSDHPHQSNDSRAKRILDHSQSRHLTNCHSVSISKSKSRPQSAIHPAPWNDSIDEQSHLFEDNIYISADAKEMLYRPLSAAKSHSHSHTNLTHQPLSHSDSIHSSDDCECPFNPIINRRNKRSGNFKRSDPVTQYAKYQKYWNKSKVITHLTSNKKPWL